MLQDGTTVPFWLKALPEIAQVSFSPTRRGEEERDMSEEGMRAFAAFAREQSFLGATRDHSPSWNSGFKKSAPPPGLGEDKGRRGGDTVRSDGRERRHGHRVRRRRGENDDNSRRDDSRRKSRRSTGREAPEEDKPGKSRGDEEGRGRTQTRGRRDGDFRSRSEGRGRSPKPFHPSMIRPEVPAPTWRKKAPSGRDLPEGTRSSTPELEQKPAGPPFGKKAEIPEFPEVREPELRVRITKPVAGATASGSKDKETTSMRNFDERCLGLYSDLLSHDQEMEITGMLAHVVEGEWAEAFADLTRPKRAATGLVYIRMMEDYMRWYKEQKLAAPERSLPPCCKDVFWLYLHHVKTNRAGKYSPKAAHLALRYFADCFGFSDEAVTYRRVRRLVENCSKLEGPRNQADMIPVATLDFLEHAVGDPTLALGVRIAAGKLRLCVQSSLRWDDLSRTPIGKVEWVRRRGSKSIIGLRSKDAQSKTGVRPWVASYLGVTDHSDDWLAILVQMLLEIHGSAWQSHDHTGKSTPDGRSAKTSVASFNQDVAFVRALLVQAVDEGLNLGLNRSQAAGLRWHGAKSTLTSFMMHCKVGDRAVRFAGNWKDQREAMPDTYLREAQLLVLEAQEQVLKYIRSGGFVATLEGIPLGPGTSVGQEEAENPEYQKALEDIAKVAQASPMPAGLETKDVARAVLDDAASHGGEVFEEQLAAEKQTEVSNESVDALLEEAVDRKVAEVAAVAELDEGEDSSDEFYDGCYLQVPQSLRGSFHRPSGSEVGLPRCGTKAKSFVPVSVEEKIGKKASFCSKCFGKLKAGGCDKTCSHTKVIMVDGQELLVKCVRRCERKCERLAGFMDIDDRDHRCSIHEDPAEASSEEDETGAVEVASTDDGRK